MCKLNYCINGVSLYPYIKWTHNISDATPDLGCIATYICWGYRVRFYFISFIVKVPGGRRPLRCGRVDSEAETRGDSSSSSTPPGRARRSWDQPGATMWRWNLAEQHFLQTGDCFSEEKTHPPLPHGTSESLSLDFTANLWISSLLAINLWLCAPSQKLTAAHSEEHHLRSLDNYTICMK